MKKIKEKLTKAIVKDFKLWLAQRDIIAITKIIDRERNMTQSILPKMQNIARHILKWVPRKRAFPLTL